MLTVIEKVVFIHDLSCPVSALSLILNIVIAICIVQISGITIYHSIQKDSLFIKEVTIL